MINKAETTILEALFTRGTVTVTPNSSEHKAARKLAAMFGIIERETVCGACVVYVYRISEHAARVALANSGTE